MSRILLSAYACEPGRGSEAQVGWLWATELAAAGHEIWVITRDANREAITTDLNRHRRPRLHFVFCDLPGWLRGLKRGSFGVYWYYALWQWMAFRQALRLSRSANFDWAQHVTFVGLRAPSFMGWLGIPFILGPVSGGEVVPDRLRRGMSLRARVAEWLRDLSNFCVRHDPLMRASFRKARKILLATAESKRLIPPEFHDKCAVQLGVGLSSEFLGWMGPARCSCGPTLRLLYAGRLVEWKGVDLALRAVQKLRDRGIAVQFSIVGSGAAERSLCRLVTDLRLSDVVRWQGWLPQDQLLEQYRSHDVLLFPSLRDSGGMVVLEALAHGLPVVCTDLGGPGVIVNTRCGRVVGTAGRGRDEVVSGLAEALAEMHREPALRKRLSRGACSRAWQFDFRRVVTGLYGGEGNQCHDGVRDSRFTDEQNPDASVHGLTSTLVALRDEFGLQT